MQALHYQITLNDDVILSSNCSSAEHSSLDYIPGSALLGVLADKLYHKLSEEQTFTLFHSGKVRFNNGYINQALPLPLSWHTKKGEQAVDGTQHIQPKKVFDLSHQDISQMQGQQPKQMRHGYIDQAWQLHNPKSGFRLKTAIDPATGRAQDSQLFGYQHMNKEQQFYGTIILDDGIDEALHQHIKTELEGCFRLGRSKSSQYGRASLQWLEQESSHSGTAGKKITIWCLSDCCLYDSDTGQPVLQVQAKHLGLEGKVIKDQSFIRTRRYIPYNVYRGGHELERQVISKGSVISIELSESIDEQTIRQLEDQGLGLYKEQGLGQIAVNHPWLSSDYKPAADSVEETLIAQKTVPVVNTPLFHWLEKQGGSDQRLQEYIDHIIDSVKVFYHTGRKFQAVARQQSYGLSSTQWGHLYDIAKSNRTLSSLDSSLFSASDALCKYEHNEEWTLSRNEKGHSFTDWLHDQFNQLQQNNELNERDVSIILTRAAKKARTQNEQWLKGKDLQIKTNINNKLAGGQQE